MAVRIATVEPGSYAEKAGLLPGDILLTLNSHEILDVLDYRFYLQSRKLSVTYRRGESEYAASIRKSDPLSDIGLDFPTYLMDAQHSCKNDCIFCFVHQMPKGLRNTLYFKDDDARMSFLFGNYITLTGLSEREIERIVEMHISPMNISVHTMNPVLRVKMMKNRFAGESLKILDRFSDAGIEMNTQLVLCPGLNDGEELRFSLEELSKHAPCIRSIAAVPVGLTKYREGLPELRSFDKRGAAEVLRIIDEFNAHYAYFHGGRRLAYASDEFYLLAGQPLPPAAHYGEYDQLENGVGMCTLLRTEFLAALQDAPKAPVRAHRISLATGELAYSLLLELTEQAIRHFPGLEVTLYRVKNEFFGSAVTVAGLLTGQDLERQLSGKDLGEKLLIPRVSLRNEGDRFLDDMTLEALSDSLGVPVIPVPNDGALLLQALLEV